MRYRLAIEIEYADATEEHDDEIRLHLASFVHAAASSGMLTSEALDLDEVVIEQLGVFLERLPESVVKEDCEEEED